MTSANDTPGGDFDERLAKAFEDALGEGEQLVAQETGDHGQAIALTKSRILVVKAGFAATGELDGHKLSTFDLDKVTAVNLRKGPLGAVIQICADGNGASAQVGTPDNVVVFTGPGRVKRAEAFAAQVEFLSGKAVNRVDPTARPETPTVRAEEPQAPTDASEQAAPTQQNAEAEQPAAPPVRKGGRNPKSLSEEIYEEVVAAGQTPAPQDLSARAEAAPQPQTDSTPTVAEPAPAPVVEEIEEEKPAPGSQYNPNPKLPKPMRRQKKGPSGVLVLVGITAALVLVGMAIMAPVRQAQNDSGVAVDTDKSSGRKLAAIQLNAVTKYRAEVAPLIAKAQAEGVGMASAARSGNTAAAKSIGQAVKTDAALTSIGALEAPPGLAEAKENLEGGLLAQKTAIATAAAAAQTGSIPAKETVTRLDEAQAQISKGMAAISRAQAQLEKQTSPAESPKGK